MSEESLHVGNLFVDRGGRPVLWDNSIELRRGAITALLGPNGAGKSTLVMTLAGLLPARSGRVEYAGVSLLGLSPCAIRRKGVALVSEGHPVLGNLTVMDNLRAAGLFLTRSEADREVSAALELLPELSSKLNVEAKSLSGGQKQMVSIAQALISRPRFLLIDELSFGLAPAIVTRLGSRVQAIAERGTGILLIEQFTKFALTLASRALVMERGRLIFDGEAAELRSNQAILHSAYLATGKDHANPPTRSLTALDDHP